LLSDFCYAIKPH
jgi:hypothetical protein